MRYNLAFSAVEIQIIQSCASLWDCMVAALLWHTLNQINSDQHCRALTEEMPELQLTGLSQSPGKGKKIGSLVSITKTRLRACKEAKYIDEMNSGNHQTLETCSRYMHLHSAIRITKRYTRELILLFSWSKHRISTLVFVRLEHRFRWCCLKNTGTGM